VQKATGRVVNREKITYVREWEVKATGTRTLRIEIQGKNDPLFQELKNTQRFLHIKVYLPTAIINIMWF